MILRRIYNGTEGCRQGREFMTMSKPTFNNNKSLENTYKSMYFDAETTLPPDVDDGGHFTEALRLGEVLEAIRLDGDDNNDNDNINEAKFGDLDIRGVKQKIKELTNNDQLIKMDEIVMAVGRYATLTGNDELRKHNKALFAARRAIEEIARKTRY
jgi:hypothetical protein